MKSLFFGEFKTIIKKAKIEYIKKFLVSLALRGILLAIPLLFSTSINYITKNDFNNALIFFIISIACHGLYRGLEIYNQVAYYKLYNKIFAHYNNIALSKTKDNSMFSLSRFSPGQYSNMVVTDVDIISGFLSTLVIRVVQMIELIIIFGYFYFLNNYIFMSAIIISLILFIIALKSGQGVQIHNEKRKRELDKVVSSTYDYFGGIKEVKSFNIFSKIGEKLEIKRDNYLEANARYNIVFQRNNILILFIFEVFRILSIIYLAYISNSGAAVVGTLLIIYNYYQKIIDNFSIILTLNVEYRNVKVSIQRFDKIREYSKIAENKEMEGIDIKGDITFKNILYGFRDNPILDNVSFKIPKNSITVLNGDNETAELGVFDLLLKLNRQHEGSIKIDDIDINMINDDYYYDLISCVKREAWLFDLSIKENMTMINPNFDKIVELFEVLDIDSDINGLDKKYDTVLNENTSLSTSTRKMLIIARALLKDSKIIMLDDIINLLDKKHERKLLDYLMSKKEDHTILIMSNSKRIIDRADQVLNIDKLKEWYY